MQYLFPAALIVSGSPSFLLQGEQSRPLIIGVEASSFLCVLVTPSSSPGCLGEWMRKDTQTIQNDTDGPFCFCLNWVEDGKHFCVPVGFRNGYK